MRIIKYLNFVWLLVVMAATTYAQTIYVVSVGVADYQNINDLNFTEDDVRLFNSIMVEHNAKITILIGSQATHANVVKTIRDVFAQAKPTDSVIFFFSGHAYGSTGGSL